MKTKNRHSLYHVTARKNLAGILRKGLLANDEGVIFAIIDSRLAERIALTQIFELDYAVIRILPEGITGRVTNDHVAEITAPWHRVVKQRRIAPEFLEVVGEYRAELRAPSDDEVRLWEFTGRSRAECIENARRLFEMCWQSRRSRRSKMTG